MNCLEMYEKIIKSKQAVLYLEGFPGTGKTQILKSIAIKNNWQYFDFRLSQRDSSEIIGVPSKKVVFDEETKKDIPLMEYAIPEVYYLANKKPTLIVFEELPRAALETRNAALQVFLEKIIGTYQLNDNVYFAATGNLGENANKEDNDGCDGDIFDQALNGRLAIIRHNLTFNEWCENFAFDNINPFIINFIKNNLDHFYFMNLKDRVYTSPRAYTFFSNFIGKDNSNLDQIISELNNFGSIYLHSKTVACLVRYLQDLTKLTVNDILDRYDEVKGLIKNFNKSFLNEFLEKFKTVKVEDLKKAQLNNLISFLDESIPDDEKCSFLCHIIDTYLSDDDNNDETKLDTIDETVELKKIPKNVLKIIEHFSDYMDILDDKFKQKEEEEKAEENTSKKEDEE